MALIGNTIMQITFIYGMDNTTAGNASLMYSTVPIFIALLSVQLKMEKVTSSTWLGIFISFVGIALILTKKENGFTFSTDTFTGDILILATSFSWSAYTVLAKPLIEKTSMLKVVSITFIFGTLFLIPFGIPDFISMDWSSVSYGAWSALFYSFLFANVIAYLIWFYSVTKVGNVQTAIFQNMVPVFAVIIAVIFLNEKLSWIQAIGGAGIIGGVTITRLTMNNRKNIKH